ncbi:hypothetical protein E3E38_08805 [Thermococcus sp. 18S1]|uniref:hypothetical protein n=1 Tax=Thermococcus sp. 18S1 TaxID=1638210 RepID=UPI00143C22A1|nr:hypothetical protein [Thermococcus sp. 18S1]NJE31140.1 hypothetical protein [Thermococcus sp. 18S1]
MVVGDVEGGMEKVGNVGLDMPAMPSPKSGMGLVEVIIQILRENEIRMSFKDFRMDGEVRFRFEPLHKE